MPKNENVDCARYNITSAMSMMGTEKKKKTHFLTECSFISFSNNRSSKQLREKSLHVSVL